MKKRLLMIAMFFILLVMPIQVNAKVNEPSNVRVAGVTVWRQTKNKKGDINIALCWDGTGKYWQVKAKTTGGKVLWSSNEKYDYSKGTHGTNIKIPTKYNYNNITFVVIGSDRKFKKFSKAKSVKKRMGCEHAYVGPGNTCVYCKADKPK